MVKIDTIEAYVDDAVWCHFDVGNDVLYLRMDAARDTSTLGDENEEGVIVFRREDNDELVGYTIVDWWRLYGEGIRPDSLHQFEQVLEPWAQRLLAESGATDPVGKA